MPHSLGGRTRYAALAVGTIVLGLAVYGSGSAIPPVVRDVLGDALWAAMMTWWISAIAPGMPPRWRSLVALAVCFAVEISQLVHFPAIDAIRRTTAGHLVLGSGFEPRDFWAYAVGVLAAVLLDRVLKLSTPAGEPRAARSSRP